MKAYFDRTEPYYLTREPSFDGIPVEVSEVILNVLDARKGTLKLMEEAIDESGAPEDCGQDLTDLLVGLIEQELNPNG